MHGQSARRLSSSAAYLLLSGGVWGTSDTEGDIVVWGTSIK
jgi:hypothetical protein